ncbi:ribosome maturation factor RimM [Sulfobacillus harzensis]|uniref:Ribosome maturation factor RimM n=1 Tax=Sulfobacillus harzensis TaxID=2729629 RepID=A0A7Y0L7W0_9FIRM|nr:ribosome maturation factor RimM [Sulfobacillus harzensis]NMP24607.1 16S rRNA processing protein RimM [Sulfobacillus harzensis]
MSRRTADVWPGHVMIGQVTSPFGIDGSVKVFPTTDFPERLLGLKQVTVDVLGGSRPVLTSRLQPPMAVIHIAGINTREEAEALRGAILMVPETDLPKLPQDEYYWHQLVGMEVREDSTNRFLGRLSHVLRTGAGHDVFEVEREGKKPLLIPALKTVVKHVDILEREMRVDLLPGLEDISE